MNKRTTRFEPDSPLNVLDDFELKDQVISSVLIVLYDQLLKESFITADYFNHIYASI